VVKRCDTKHLVRLQSAGFAVLPLRYIEDHRMSMKLRRSVAIDGSRGIVLESGGDEFPVVSGAWTLPIRACVYRSSSEAPRGHFLDAPPHPLIAPTSAVSDIDFGAENVASHPARCSALVTSLPNFPS